MVGAELMVTRRLFFISCYDLSMTPYADVALPALARDGWDILVAAVGAESSLLRKTIPYECKARNLLRQQGHSLWSKESELLRELLAARFGPYDVIYVHSEMLCARAALALAGPRLGKRLVYHNPDYYDPITHPLYTRLEGRFCRKVDLHLNNEFHRGYISRAQYRMTCPIITAPPNLPAAWPIPSRSEAKRAEMCGGEDAFVLMLHGPYSELRMVPQLFEALSLLPERFRLVMTGANVRKAEADAMLQRFGVSERVLRLPTLGYHEMFEYTVNADAGVLLYKNNDLGNFFTSPGRISEYLACGIPVLATDHTGLENLVSRLDLGECVDSTAPRRIAAGLTRLAESTARGRHPRDRMRERFLKHFAFDHWEPKICQAFNDLLVRGKMLSSPPSPWIPGT
jgi:glycosyltransferase involved in cell wall biosynthesis